MVCLHALAPRVPCLAMAEHPQCYSMMVSAAQTLSAAVTSKHRCNQLSWYPDGAEKLSCLCRTSLQHRHVVQTAAADPTTLAQADNIVKAVQSKAPHQHPDRQPERQGAGGRSHYPGILCASPGGCVSCLRPSLDCSESPTSTCRLGRSHIPHPSMHVQYAACHVPLVKGLHLLWAAVPSIPG